MLLELAIVLALLSITVSVVLYLRTQSLKQFERAFQARMDALRSSAELREIAARTGRKLRDAAMEEVARGRSAR